MKLFINVSGNIGGGGRQVATSFINECKKFHENEYFVVMGESIKDEIDVTKFPSNFSFFYTGKSKFYLLHCKLSKIEQQTNPNVVFTIFGPAYWKPRAPHLEGFAISHHIFPESKYFELISLKQRIIWKIKKILHLKYINWESNAIVSETTFTTERISKLLFKNKIFFTVSNTCSHYFYDAKYSNMYHKLPSRQTNEFRLLTISKYYRHKNLEQIPALIDELQNRGINNIKFILTIDRENYNRIFNSKYYCNIITIGNILNIECPSLYAECDAMFLPTMLESFSASYPEAMATQKPILTSNYDFARRVCQDAALYFDPLNVKDIADKIEMLIKNPVLYQKLINKGEKILKTIPSAEERAVEYLNICKQLIK